MIRRSVITVAAVLSMSGAAIAEDYCTGEGEPMPVEQIIKKLGTLGYEKVKELEKEHGCYEAKGFDKDGKRVEIYIEPATGEIVKIKQ